MPLYKVFIPIEGKIVVMARADDPQKAMNEAVKECLNYSYKTIIENISSIDIKTNRTGSFFAHKIED